MRCAALSFVLAFAMLGGCLERRMYITSEPSGARVWVNDVDAGTTPLKIGYLYHGNYDVRISKDGYEPVIVSKKAFAPWYESVPFDLVAQTLPMRIVNEQRWHWNLVQSPEHSESERRAAVERARAMRSASDVSR